MRFSSFIYLVGQGLHSMKANRLMTFASMGVLTVCMILVGTAFLFGVNIDAVVQYMGSQNESYVSVSDDATEEQINALGDQIGAVNGVSSVVFISREEALQQYDTMLSSYTDLYAALAEDNPLPQMFCVSVNDVAQMQRIVDEISTFEFVDGVDAAIDTANTFLSLQRIVNYICIGLVGVLALVSIVVISNTIRIPSIRAIDGVLNYTHHNYLYMCAKEDLSGRHNFARTLAEHSRNAQRYQSALNRLHIR